MPGFPLVILGGGFAGVETAIAVKAMRPSQRVVLVSETTDLVYRPWLIYVPAGRKRLSELSIPIRPLADRYGFELVDGRCLAVDFEARQVHVSRGQPQSYSALLLATGAQADRDLVPGAREHALFPCDPADADRMRTRIDETAPRRIAVVVGWDRLGPGLEFAAWLGKRKPRNARPKAEVVAIDGDGSLLKHYTNEALVEMRRVLVGRGVRLEAEAGVSEVTDRGPVVAGRRIDAEITAVVSPLHGVDLDLPATMLDNRGFVSVDECFETAVPGVFAFGDAAAPATTETPRAMMVIMQLVQAVCANLVARIEGASPKAVLGDFRSRLIVPNLGGKTVAIRDGIVVGRGRWPLLRRYLYDRRYFLQRSG